MTRLAALRARQGSAETAEPLAREALDVLERTLPRDHWLTAVAEGVLGRCLSDLGRFAQAEPLLIHGHDILSRAPTRRAAPDLRDVRRYLVEHFVATGQPDKAARYRFREDGDGADRRGVT